jgi:hypothetical protein
MGCRAKCELQITKTEPYTFDTKLDQPGDILVNRPAKADLDAADKALRAKIAAWEAPVTVTDCADKVHCECHQTDDITDDDWKKKKVLTRRWAHKFTSNGFKFEMWADVDYRIAYAAGACEEPKKQVFYVSAGAIPEKGLLVLADEGAPLDAAMMERIRKALG